MKTPFRNRFIYCRSYFKLRLQLERRRDEKLWQACYATGHGVSVSGHPITRALWGTVKYLLTGRARN